MTPPRRRSRSWTPQKQPPARMAVSVLSLIALSLIRNALSQPVRLHDCQRSRSSVRSCSKAVLTRAGRRTDPGRVGRCLRLSLRLPVRLRSVGGDWRQTGSTPAADPRRRPRQCRAGIAVARPGAVVDDVARACEIALATSAYARTRGVTDNPIRRLGAWHWTCLRSAVDRRRSPQRRRTRSRRGWGPVHPTGPVDRRAIPQPCQASLPHLARARKTTQPSDGAPVRFVAPVDELRSNREWQTNDVMGCTVDAPAASRKITWREQERKAIMTDAQGEARPLAAFVGATNVAGTRAAAPRRLRDLRGRAPARPSPGTEDGAGRSTRAAARVDSRPQTASARSSPPTPGPRSAGPATGATQRPRSATAPRPDRTATRTRPP